MPMRLQTSSARAAMRSFLRLCFSRRFSRRDSLFPTGVIYLISLPPRSEGRVGGGGCLSATLFTLVSSLATQPNQPPRQVESLLPPNALYAAGTGVAKLPAMLERGSLGNVVAVPASEDGSTEPFATPLTEHASRQPVAPPIPRGERVGPWTIERELGRGGMGVVYEGRRAGGARAAIKL